MEQWKCATHHITLTVEGNKRDFQTPPGSIRGLPACELLTMAKPRKGKVKDCEIVREGKAKDDEKEREQ